MKNVLFLLLFNIIACPVYPQHAMFHAHNQTDCTPTTANAGPSQNRPCGTTTATLAGNTPTSGTGAWSVVSGTATITTPSSPTSGVTGLAISGTATLRWTISYPPCTASTSDVTIITSYTPVFAAANLNVGSRISGFVIGQNMTAPGGDQKYCYNDVEANCTTYGGLYEWKEALNYTGGYSSDCDPCTPGSTPPAIQAICPAGYHIPSDLEFSRYEYCIENSIAPIGNTSLVTFQTTGGARGSNSTAGAGAKMKSSTGWNGTNTSGFNMLPAGYRPDIAGNFQDLNSIAYLWTGTPNGGFYAWYHPLADWSSQSSRGVMLNANGSTVRCMQD